MMRSVNLKVVNRCNDCGLRADHFFCGISESGLKAFEELKITNGYPAGSLLFVEGQPGDGVYVLCQGRVKLYTCSREGKVVILHIAEPGELLGVSAVISGEAYEVSAEVLEPTQTNYVRRSDFLRLIEKHTDIAMRTVQHLSHQYQDAYRQIRSLGLSTSVGDKLADLLLAWCGAERRGREPVQVPMRYTHEEMAEMIGSSRETVTRLLKQFRELDLISIEGSQLRVHDPKRFDGMIGQPRGTQFKK